MTPKRTPIFILKIAAAAAFALLCADTSLASERWRTVIWDDDADEIAKFEAFCLERGMTSFDVLEANGHSSGELPSKGEELLLPESKNDIFATWMEVQNRKESANPLVTIRLHGVPARLRENIPAAETSAPAPEPIQAYAPDEPADNLLELLKANEIAEIQEPAEFYEPADVPEPAAIEEQPVALSAAALEALFAQFQETPLVTVRLHDVPGSVRDNSPAETQPAATIPSIPAAAPVPEPASVPAPVREPSESTAPQRSQFPQSPGPAGTETDIEPEDPLSNIRIVVSGDEIVLLAPDRPERTFWDLDFSPLPRVQPQAAEPGDRMMTWPVSGRVSSGFGRRGRGLHTGIDIPMPSGTPIVAALDGVVVETATSSNRRFRGYGNTVVLYHGNGLATWYAHCSRFNVSQGQQVRRGEIIAFVGNTGRTTTHHVHFEVRENGSPVNPIPYLMPR